MNTQQILEDLFKNLSPEELDFSGDQLIIAAQEEVSRRAREIEFRAQEKLRQDFLYCDDIINIITINTSLATINEAANKIRNEKPLCFEYFINRLFDKLSININK